MYLKQKRDYRKNEGLKNKDTSRKHGDRKETRAVERYGRQNRRTGS
jgi:hypothetical protein